MLHDQLTPQAWKIIRTRASSTFDLTLRSPPAAATTPSMTDIGGRIRVDSTNHYPSYVSISRNQVDRSKRPDLRSFASRLAAAPL